METYQLKNKVRIEEVNFDQIADDTKLRNISELKINPDFYVHLALANVIKPEGMDAGNIHSFLFRVDTLESIASSFGFMPDDYEAQIKEYADSIKEKDNNIRMFRIAQKKLRLICKNIGDRREIIDDIKF